MKSLKLLHWLDITEYLVIFLTFISLLIYLLFHKLILFLVFSLFSLTVNIINRIRQQYKIRKKINSNLNNKEDFNISIAKINQGENLSEQIALIERNIDKLVDYLEDNRLVERIKQLENSQKPREVKPEIVSPTVINATRFKYRKTPPTNAAMDWKLINTIDAHQDAVTKLVINDEQNYLFSVSWDKTLKIWDLKTGGIINSIAAHDQGILTLAGNGQLVVTGGFDQQIKLWSIDNKESVSLKQEQILTNHSGSIHDLVIAANKKILISGSYDQTIKQWDLQTGQKITSSLDESGAIYAIAIHEDSQLIVSGSGDGTVSLWKLQTGESLGKLAGNICSVQSLAISQDGQFVAAGCIDGTIKLWQFPQTEKPLHTLNAHDGQVMSLVFDPNNLLFSGGAEGTIKIWHKDSEQPLAVILEHDQRILCLALNQSGNLLVSGNLQGVIKIWQLNLTA
jgi:hypothetical protein